MKNAEEALIVAKEMFQELGIETFARSLQSFIESNGEESLLQKLYEEFESWIELQLNSKKKKRMFSFGNCDNYIVSRFFIISVLKRYENDGAPILILNEMPEDVTLKDNPIKNLKLIYESEDDRDRDYEKLKRILE